MFKKIALFSLLSAPLVGAETPKIPIIDTSTITSRLKALEQGQTELAALTRKTNKNVQSLNKPGLRTKMFVAGALAGSALTIYIQKHDGELIKSAQAILSKIQKAFDTAPSQRAPSKIFYKENSDSRASDESGVEDEAAAEEEKDAKDSNSCYFK